MTERGEVWRTELLVTVRRLLSEGNSAARKVQDLVCLLYDTAGKMANHNEKLLKYSNKSENLTLSNVEINQYNRDRSCGGASAARPGSRIKRKETRR